MVVIHGGHTHDAMATSPLFINQHGAAMARNCGQVVHMGVADDAAGEVTKAIYGLGLSRVEHDCPGGGSSRYVSWTTVLTMCLHRPGFGNGKYVNCTDCATFVSTFSNLLCADLWQSRMESGFKLYGLRR